MNHFTHLVEEASSFLDDLKHLPFLMILTRLADLEKLALNPVFSTSERILIEEIVKKVKELIRAKVLNILDNQTPV